ncbi:hypothetical protein ACJMK2_001915, partial [Sinanodonta woodiana]
MNCCFKAPSNSCDMGYMNISLGGSYFCIKPYLILKTFNDAMKQCESEKAKLLVITTIDQIADLKPQLHAGCTYVGISDETKEGTWVTWDGTAVNLTWSPFDPNGGNSENCGIIYSSYIIFFKSHCQRNNHF